MSYGQQITEGDIAKRFKHHPPKDAAVGQLHGEVRDAIGAVARDLVDNIPPCRELALAVTKLEEAMMWANAAIAREMSAE